jgi:aerobic carbon-monoxide dehydrogenase large subunit
MFAIGPAFAVAMEQKDDRMTHAAANTASGVGASLLRKEDARHLRGRGQFVSDVQLPRMQDVAFVRSPHAHARIKGIAVAPNASGRIFTARDLPRLGEMRAVPQVPGFKVSGYPPLATQKVRYVGEAIAACIAPTRAEAEDLAKTVSVDFEVLPAVIDAAAALTDASSLVHENWSNNLFIERVFQDGDIDAVARTADVVVRRNYRMHRHVAVPLEGRAVLAYRDHRLDELVVYTSTQVPHIIRLGLSEVLGLDERRIRVIAPDVGGGFGSKARLSPEEAAIAALALEVDHPVRWVEDRGEHFLASTHTRDHHYRVAAHADKRGRLLGIDVELLSPETARSATSHRRRRRRFGTPATAAANGSAAAVRSFRATKAAPRNSCRTARSSCRWEFSRTGRVWRRRSPRSRTRSSASIPRRERAIVILRKIFS